jgi:hypothetical protein
MTGRNDIEEKSVRMKRWSRRERLKQIHQRSKHIKKKKPRNGKYEEENRMEKKDIVTSVRAEVEVTLSQEDIDDIMCGALEGGITYWCCQAEVVGPYLGQYAHEQIARDGKLLLHLIEPFDDADTKVYELDLEKFKNGVSAWVEEPIGCNCLEQTDGKFRFDTGNADAIVCDAIIQYALFGGIVFG